jgi:cytochrome P450
VFDKPDEIRLDRKPNQHVAFGAGAHFCLGAAHARLIIRELLQQFAATTTEIRILSEVPHVEVAAIHTRSIGYERLVISLR